jgi:DNA-binding transcriptional MerR regulator
MKGQDLDPALGCKVYRDAVRISELADRVGVPTSTVRYYERIGLLGLPNRTPAGYRDYGEDTAARLLFVSRARKMGLTCEQITELLPIWDGTNCAAAHDRVGQLVEDKQAEIAERIEELERFAAELDTVRAALATSPPPHACRTDLGCCVPEVGTGPVSVDLVPRRG